MVVLPLARLSAYAQSDKLDGPSPADIHAEVIAQGVGTLPSGELAWRLVSAKAQPVGETTGVQRALGFTVADDAALLVTDENSGARTRLGAGEASFVASGATQRVERLGDAGNYWRIGLVPVDSAQNPGDDTLVLGSDGFTVTDDGDRDLDLVAAKLDNKKSTTVKSEFPVLVVVTSGTASVAPAGSDDATDVAAGDATVIDGSVKLTSKKNGTRVLVAVIGAAIPASQGQVVATSTPTGDDDDDTDVPTTSKIIVYSVQCPPGVTADEALDFTNGNACFGGDPVTSMTVTATNDQTGDTYSDTINPNNGQAFIGDLPAGDYSVQFDAGDGFGETVGVCGGQDQSSDLEVKTFSGSYVDLSLPAQREYDCSTSTLTPGDDSGDDDSGSQDGELIGMYFACPVGMTWDDFDSLQCNVITDGFDAGFQGSTDLHLSDAELNGDAYFWEGLPLNDGDSWSVAVYQYPDGYDTFAFSSDAAPIHLPQAGGYLLNDDTPSHTAELYFLSSGN